MKIGILGGTFDPVHHGHLSIARHARDRFGLDKVIFVPAFIPPHKDVKEVMAPAEDRLEMVKLATQSDKEFEVSDIEFKRDGPSYTIDTVRAFKREYPEDQLFLIMGADSLPQIPTWKEPEELRRLAEFLVAPRPECELKTDGDDRIHRLDFPEMSISASEIRRGSFEDRGLLLKSLPSGVLDYILAKQLYAGDLN